MLTRAINSAVYRFEVFRMVRDGMIDGADIDVPLPVHLNRWYVSAFNQARAKVISDERMQRKPLRSMP